MRCVVVVVVVVRRGCVVGAWWWWWWWCVVVVVGWVVVVVGWSWCGDGLGCAVEQTERGKRFGDAAGHVLDCGYLMAQFAQPSVGR